MQTENAIDSNFSLNLKHDFYDSSDKLQPCYGYAAL